MENKIVGNTNLYSEKMLISFSNFNCEFILAKGIEIMLLNFEDDTFRIVTKQDNSIMDRVKQLYHDCSIIIDFETTNYFATSHFVAENIFFGDKIFNDLHIKMKPKLLETYIPLALVNYEIAQQMNEKHFYPEKEAKLQCCSLGKYILEKLNIVIPEKILPGKKEVTPLLVSVSVPVPVPYNDCFHNCLEPEPYNLSLQNALSPDFSSNCLFLQYSSSDCKKKIYNMKTIYVIFNYKFLCTRVFINPDVTCKTITRAYPEYGFSELFEMKTENSEIVKCVKDKLDNVIFDSVDELNTHLQLLAEHIVLIEEDSNSKEKQYQEEEKQVKQYFDIYYEIDDNIEHKIKASDFCDIITNSFLVNIRKDSITSFRNRLSKYLADMGLKKKRFNDGFYYYGIKFKLQQSEINDNMRT